MKSKKKMAANREWLRMHILKDSKTRNMKHLQKRNMTLIANLEFLAEHFEASSLGYRVPLELYSFFTLKPDPISEGKERENMHYFARLNADPDVHVTYSGLMYKVISQHDLNDESTDMNLLTNPNPDVHCCNIDYEGRFIDGRVFDSSFDGQSDGTGCTFPAKSLIAGLHQGLGNMTRESVFEFYMPPHLGYGERGSEFIPPHEPLVFKVRLNDFWKDQDLNRPRRFKLID